MQASRRQSGRAQRGGFSGRWRHQGSGNGGASCGGGGRSGGYGGAWCNRGTYRGGSRSRALHWQQHDTGAAAPREGAVAFAAATTVAAEAETSVTAPAAGGWRARRHGRGRGGNGGGRGGAGAPTLAAKNRSTQRCQEVENRVPSKPAGGLWWASEWFFGQCLILRGPLAASQRPFSPVFHCCTFPVVLRAYSVRDRK